MASVTTKIAVEGASKFKADFREAGLAVKATSSELKFLSNELGRTGASEEALANKSSALKSAIEAESNAIKLLQDRLSVLADNGAENSAEAQKWTAELYKHKDAMGALQSELDETNEAMKSFGSGSEEAKTEVDELGDQAEQAGEQIGSNFATDIAVANTVVSKLADLAIEAVKSIIDLGKGAVSYNAQMESYSKTISAFFRTSGQSAEEASKNTADLIANQKELSLATGMATDKLIDANKMLIASGVNGDDAQRAISALSKAIVATGGGNEELSRMASNLQQISNTGKASSADMKQFAMAGVDLYGLMADSTGKTVDELKDMDITFDMIVEALDSATAEGGKFFEASQVGANTLNGQMNTLQSTIQDGLGKAFEPVNEALSESLVPLAQELVNNIDWEKIGNGVAEGINALTDLMTKITEVVEWIEAQNMEEKGKGFVEDFATGMHNNNGLMGVTASHLMDAFYADVQEGRSQATLVGKDITESMAHGMASGKSGVVASAEEVQMSAFAVWNQTQQAEQYGMDFVSGFANGMHRNNGLIASAAATIANTIKEWLHFSRPDVGPLRDYESWMPDFVEGLARTMKESEWMLADASQELAQTITNNTVTNNINMTINGSQGQNVNDLADVVMLRIQQATDRRSAVWA